MTNKERNALYQEARHIIYKHVDFISAALESFIFSTGALTDETFKNDYLNWVRKCRAACVEFFNASAEHHDPIPHYLNQ